MRSPRSPSKQTRCVLGTFLGDPTAWLHGYALILRTKILSGTLYPLLRRLEERGVLESRWTTPVRPGPPVRRLYRLSEAGVRYAASPPRPKRQRAGQ